MLIEEKALTNFTYDDQVKKLKKGYEVSHPAVLMQALLEYHKKTGKYAMEDWYSRTLLFDSDLNRVFVGHCDAKGVSIVSWSDGRRDDSLGVSASRKFKKSIDTGSLESREAVEEFRVAAIERLETLPAKIYKSPKEKGEIIHVLRTLDAGKRAVKSICTNKHEIDTLPE